jgi:hypothetical protein
MNAHEDKTSNKIKLEYNGTWNITFFFDDLMPNGDKTFESLPVSSFPLLAFQLSTSFFVNTVSASPYSLDTNRINKGKKELLALW